MPLDSPHLLSTLNLFLEQHPEDGARLSRLADFARSAERPFDRKTLPGHVTASALVVNPADGCVLLIQHHFLGMLLQPGGHTEPGADDSILAASLRELAEETGVTTADLRPFDPGQPPVDIDIHGIPANPAKGEPEHLHFDFRHAFLLAERPETRVTLQTEEVTAHCWLPLDSSEAIQALGPRAAQRLKAWLRAPQPSGRFSETSTA